MSIFNEITALAEAAADPAVHEGYPPTGATVPYSVHRPLSVNPEAEAVTGDAIDWDYQSTLYACGASVEASFNLAMLLLTALQGARAGGTTLRASMGYSGAPVEGHYECAVIVQLNQGGML